MIVPFPSLGDVKATLISVVLNTISVSIVGALVIVVTKDDALDEMDVPPELVAEIEKV